MIKAKRRISNRIKIVGATLTAIFSLFSVFTATYAWFSLNNDVSASGMQVQVATLTDGSAANLDSLAMIKYEYAYDQFGDRNYIEPQKGAAKKYMFNEEESSFGEYFDYYYCTECDKLYCVTELNYDSSYKCPENPAHTIELQEKVFHCEECEKTYAESEVDLDDDVYKCHEDASHTLRDGRWHPVDYMNIYDPIEQEIKGENFNLRDLHCNAIYELTLSGRSAGNFNLSVFSTRLDKALDSISKVKFSTCVDFDLFTEDDLTRNLGTKEDGTTPIYYPTYRSYDPNDPDNDELLGSLDDLYQRISYYAATSPHNNFYSLPPSQEEQPLTLVHKPIVDAGNPQPSNETVIPISFTEQKQTYKIYINVNYAPSKMSGFRQQIDSGSSIIAVYDFNFNCDVRVRGEQK